MKFLKILKELFFKYNFAFFGFIIFSYYFWNRFLRLRTSKDLPLNLSILWFIIIIYICCIFAYIIFSLIISKKGNPVIEAFIDWVFFPIMEFDKFIKNISYFRPFLEKLFTFILPKLEFLIIKTQLFFIIFLIYYLLI